MLGGVLVVKRIDVSRWLSGAETTLGAKPPQKSKIGNQKS